jgi:hypothetical protein
MYMIISSQNLPTNLSTDFLTSWVPQTPGFADLCGQWEIYLKKFQALANEYEICIVPGTIVERHEEETSEEFQLMNVAYFIGNKGEIIGKYVKKNLWYVTSISFLSSNSTCCFIKKLITMPGIPNAPTLRPLPTTT